MTFKPGDVAIYVRPGSPAYGQEVTIVEGPVWITTTYDHLGTEEPGSSHIGYRYIDGTLDPFGNRLWTARPEWLQKKKPPSRDIDRVTTWDEFQKICNWRPEGVTV